ncbi:uncharacterized protein LOC132274923 [Cornus florida]|uniref:uncharacterized protein LOC132274923 n=1 Tax=Cornus florida TaxID=4283 RepID=UPI0028A1462C|nr:uncharacterized protein LOC132274923 [Cornus florida]
MGSIQSKQKRSPCERDVKGLIHKIRVLQGEMNEVMCMRESEGQAYEREMMVYALKEAEWKRERKRLRQEVKRLRKRLEEREDRIRDMEDEIVAGEKCDKLEWPPLLGATSYMVEHMREERARRDEAVEKWKQLYLAIKIELDDLIQKTNQGDTLCWRTEEEDLMEELQRELKGKEETIELLQARIVSMEQEGSKREREVDILRQSLRIMSYKKKATHITKGHS